MESADDIETREVVACDEAFFAALLVGDHDLLGTILAGDFVIVDVLTGQVARREELLGAIRSGQLRFTEVTRYAEERSVRLRASAAVATAPTPAFASASSATGLGGAGRAGHAIFHA